MVASLDTLRPDSAFIASGGAMPAPPSPQPAAVAAEKSNGLSFGDLWDAINPLQHIPVVGMVYRELTGEKISPAARIAGDALYGGIWGLASSVVDTVVETATGKDIGEHIMATVFGDDGHEGTSEATQTAQAAGSTTQIIGVPVPASPAPAAAAAAKPDLAAAGPSGFYQSLQHTMHYSRGVPLTTSVPVGDALTGNRPVASAQTGKAVPATAAGQESPPASGAIPGSSSAFPQASPSPALPQSVSMPPSAAATPPLDSGAFSSMMMMGLDKYKALALQQDKPFVSAPTTAASLMN